MRTIFEFIGATPDDREATLGREFREIEVLRSDCCEFTVIVLEGRQIALLGDPVECLKTYLGGLPSGLPN